MAGKSIPQKTWLSPDHTEQMQRGTGTTAVHLPSGMKEGHFPTEVIDENWADSVTVTETVWM